MDPAVAIVLELIESLGPTIVKLLTAPDAIESLAAERIEDILAPQGKLALAEIRERAREQGIDAERAAEALENIVVTR